MASTKKHHFLQSPPPPPPNSFVLPLPKNKTDPSLSRPNSTVPLVSFFGRSYLLSTVRIPPFPTSSSPGKAFSPSGGAIEETSPTNWSRRKEEEEEEESRVFDWMKAALSGSGALGTTGFFPEAGSPVVLDLGAVAQVGRSVRHCHCNLLFCADTRLRCYGAVVTLFRRFFVGGYVFCFVLELFNFCFLGEVGDEKGYDA